VTIRRGLTATAPIFGLCPGLLLDCAWKADWQHI